MTADVTADEVVDPMAEREAWYYKFVVQGPRPLIAEIERLQAALRTHYAAHGGWRPVQPQLELLKLSVWIRDNSGLQDTGTLAGAKLMAQAFMYAFAAGQFTPSPKSGG